MNDLIKIYPNVKMGEVVLDDFVVLGRPARGRQPGERQLVIGDGAFIRSHSVLYAGSIIGKNLRVGTRGIGPRRLRHR